MWLVGDEWPSQRPDPDLNGSTTSNEYETYHEEKVQPMTSPETPTGQDPHRDPLPTPMGGPELREDSTPSTEGVMLGSDEAAGFDSDSDSTGSDDSTADTAKGEGRQVAQEAKEGGQRVAGVAKEEAGKVASTVGDQVKTLFSQGRSELSDQAGTQQQRLAESVRALGEELNSMAQGSEHSGPATDLARQASQRSQDFAGWLEHNEPGAALDEVKRFAQRRPGTFILLAAGVGLLAGRLTRGLTGDSDEVQDTSGQGYPVGGAAYQQAGAGPVAPAAPVATGPMAPAPVPPVGTQPGFVDDGVDYPDTAVGYPDTAVGYPEEEFAPGRQTQDGPGPR